MITAIIFDAYGTLISTGTGSVDATREMLNYYNLQHDPKLFYGEWKKIHKSNIDNMIDFKTEEEVFVQDLKILFDKYMINEIPEKAVSFMIKSLTGRKAFPDASEALRILSIDYKIYIGSTSDTQPLIENINNNDLSFDDIFTSEILREYKPQRQFYKKILEIIKKNANEVVFVGDSLIDDVSGPQSLGMYSIWLNRNKIVNSSSIMPNAEINSLSELIQILNKINH